MEFVEKTVENEQQLVEHVISLINTYRDQEDTNSFIEVKDRTSLFVFTHKRSFVGCEFVDWLEKTMSDYNSKPVSRGEALAFGNILLSKYQVFHHVTRSEPLRDSKLLYQFDDQGVLNIQKIVCSSKTRDALAVASELKETMTKLYSKYINEDGTKVNYELLGKSDEFLKEDLPIAQELQQIKLASLSTNDKKSFFINVYNALCIHGFIHWGILSNFFSRLAFFSKTKYRIDQVDYSLNDIEHGILRNNSYMPYGKILGRPFPKSNDIRLQHCIQPLDPRIHFALNCGARSCPPIRVYRNGADLDADLDKASRSFLKQETEIQNSTVVCSKIIQWYKSDFGSTDVQLLQFICQFLAQEQQQQLQALLQNGDKINIQYRNYDWTSNHS